MEVIKLTNAQRKKHELSPLIVYSLVETAKTNDIDPYEYLLPVLSLLPQLGKSPAHEKLEALMPLHPMVIHREHIRKYK